MPRLLHFLSYHNAVPIVVAVVFVGGAGAFAATNPDAIYEELNTVVSVDNTYIAQKDLSSYSPKILIGDVTEDPDHYYIAFRLMTVDIVDSVWQDTERASVLKVSKGILGEYGDLGLYATEQFKQLIDREIAYLREVQQIERRAITPKVVATTYGGLVGKLLDSTTETLPGYVPVVVPPPSPVEVASVSGGGGEVAGVATKAGDPTIQILGPNPHEIPLNSNFADLGAVASDDSGYIPIITVYVDGKLIETRPVTVDTSAPREWHIQYVATDVDGNTAAAERLVIVVDPFAPPPTPAPLVQGATTTPLSGPVEEAVNESVPASSAAATSSESTSEVSAPEETQIGEPIFVPPEQASSPEEEVTTTEQTQATSTTP